MLFIKFGLVSSFQNVMVEMDVQLSCLQSAVLKYLQLKFDHHIISGMMFVQCVHIPLKLSYMPGLCN